jgi:hypothetical protein
MVKLLIVLSHGMALVKRTDGQNERAPEVRSEGFNRLPLERVENEPS